MLLKPPGPLLSPQLSASFPPLRLSPPALPALLPHLPLPALLQALLVPSPRWPPAPLLPPLTTWAGPANAAHQFPLSPTAGR